MQFFTVRPGLLILLLLLSGLVRAEGQAQESEAQKLALIRELLEVTRAADQVVLTIENSVPMQRPANPKIPAIFWDRFLTQARARRAEFVDSLVPLYSRSFDLADLKAMVELYKSPFGQRLLERQPKLAQESMLIGQRWGMRIGSAIGQELAAEGIEIQP